MMVDLIKSLFIRFGVVGVSGSQWEYFSMLVQMSKNVVLVVSSTMQSKLQFEVILCQICSLFFLKLRIFGRNNFVQVF